MYPVPQKAASQGISEELLGQWLRKQKRDEHRVTTKVAGPGGMPWLRGGPERLDGANITAALNASLDRLQTDYVDTLLLHWPDRCAAPASSACGQQAAHAYPQPCKQRIQRPSKGPMDETGGVIAMHLTIVQMLNLEAAA